MDTLTNNMSSTSLTEDEILSYLKNKYHDDFQMIQFTKEFNGKHGIYYRAVFRSASCQETGVLYCYTENSGSGTSVEINGTKYLMKDNYANIILQTEFAAGLQAELGDGVLVKCQLKTPNVMISDQEFSAGLKACLENAELLPHLFVFILADTSARNGQLKSTAEAYLSRNNVYRQYLYIGYQSEFRSDRWETLYYENYSSFERYLADQSDAEYIEFSAFYLDEGLVKSIVVKE